MTRTHSDADAYLRAVFENTLDGLIIADDDRRYVDANPAACELIGLSRAELIGRRGDEFSPPAPADVMDRVWAGFVRAGQARGESELHRPDGERRWVEWSAKFNFVPGRHLFVFHDVTERRRLEERLSERRDVAAVLRDLMQHPTATDAAHALVERIAQLVGFECIALLRFSGTDRVAVLGAIGAITRVFRPGEILEPTSGRMLRLRVLAGPWSLSVRDQASAEIAALRAADIRAVVHVPIGKLPEPTGLLVAAVSHEEPDVAERMLEEKLPMLLDLAEVGSIILSYDIQRLSPREREVVALLRAGRAYKQIATELGMAEGTVRTLVQRAYRKLGVSSRHELPAVD